MTRTDDEGVSPSRHFAAQVKRYRLDRRWTQPELAERCQQAGLDWNRSIVANVEAGRRGQITAQEVLVLAYVLGVPPALLLFPMESGESVEVTPGRSASPWRAYKWFTGLAPFPEPLGPDGWPPLFGTEDVGAWQKAAAPITMRFEHERLIDQWMRTATDADANRSMAEGAVSEDAQAEFIRQADQARREAKAIEYKLAEHRRYMRRHDVTPEPLPDGLAHVDKLPKPESPPMPGGDHARAMRALLVERLAADRMALEAATDANDRAALQERVRSGEERLRWFDDQMQQLDETDIDKREEGEG